MFHITIARYLYVLVVFAVCLSVNSALAAPSFPELTGRVVDNAGLLSHSKQQAITQQLAAHEQETSNQVVVVTVPSLQGYDIADFGYQLGRHWGIGQAKKNNGTLLIIAPEQRKLRIEVGYGLEATLTDALSKQIIDKEIVPYFKKKQYEKGIQAGVDSILGAIGGTYKAKKFKQKSSSKLPDEIFVLVVVIIMLGNIFARMMGLKISTIVAFIAGFSVGGGYTGSWLLALYIAIATAFFHVLMYFLGEGGHGGGGSGGSGGYGGSFGSSGSFGGGSFGGGGGSFGGGGASGGW